MKIVVQSNDIINIYILQIPFDTWHFSFLGVFAKFLRLFVKIKNCDQKRKPSDRSLFFNKH